MNTNDFGMYKLVKANDHAKFGQYGYIVDLDQNILHDPLFVIKWQDGTTESYHPSNVDEVTK